MNRDLLTVLRSGYNVVLLDTFEERRALQATREIAGATKMPMFTWSVTEGFQRDIDGRLIARPDKPAALLRHIAGLTVEAIYFLKDFHPYLSDDVVARALRDLIHCFHGSRSIVLMCGHEFEVPRALKRDVLEFDFGPPTTSELRKLLHTRLDAANQERRIEVELDDADLDRLVAHLDGMTFREAERVINLLLRDERLDQHDLREVIRHKEKMLKSTGLLELVPTPADLDDIGGLEHLKVWLEKRALALSPRARELGIEPPRGILMLGVQGCGKSLCAKAAAACLNMSLVRFDPSVLYDKYVGETERNLRQVLRQAEQMAPVVMWIDEIEKMFGDSGGGDQGDGALTRRLLGYLLSWMQERDKPVFIAATSNDITKLPPELLRKGRFDEVFFVDLPHAEARRAILAIHLKSRKQDPASFDLDRLAEESDGFSGAEIEQAIIDALYEVLAGTDFDTHLVSSRLAATQPLSVMMAEKVEGLRQWARGRTVPAS